MQLITIGCWCLIQKTLKCFSKHLGMGRMFIDKQCTQKLLSINNGIVHLGTTLTKIQKHQLKSPLSQMTKTHIAAMHVPMRDAIVSHYSHNLNQLASSFFHQPRIVTDETQEVKQVAVHTIH